MIRKHLTYANVMSSIAVFLILGGGAAIAAKQKRIGSNELKAGAVTSGKIKNKAVTVSKIRDGAVSASKIADGAVTTAKIALGAVGTDRIAADAVTGEQIKESTLSEVPSAGSANPTVFAKVNANGSVDAGNSKGLSSPNVGHPFAGVYCLSVPAFAPRGGQVTPGGSGGETASIAVGGTASCPAPQVQVQIFTGGAAPALTNLTFYVELYR